MPQFVQPPTHSPLHSETSLNVSQLRNQRNNLRDEHDDVQDEESYIPLTISEGPRQFAIIDLQGVTSIDPYGAQCLEKQHNQLFDRMVAIVYVGGTVSIWSTIYCQLLIHIHCLSHAPWRHRVSEPCSLSWCLLSFNFG